VASPPPLHDVWMMPDRGPAPLLLARLALWTFAQMAQAAGIITARWAAHRKPASSRAMAVTTTVGFLPLLASAR
jgi:hypothetical protein